MLSDIVLKAKEYVKKLLEENKITPENGYFFHNWDHTQRVFQRATYLAQKEGLDEEFVEMIQLAALFHDTGFIKQYDQNEPIGAEIAEKWLRDQNYPEDKIDIVKRIILVTIPTQQPETLPCKIIKDADLDNLSSNDMFECAAKLVKELKAVKNLNVELKDLVGKDFILNYTPYTRTQSEERKKQIEINKQKIKEYVWYQDDDGDIRWLR